MQVPQQGSHSRAGRRRGIKRGVAAGDGDGGGGDEAGGGDGAHLVTTLNFGMATLDRIQSSWAKTNWWKEAAELLGWTIH